MEELVVFHAADPGGAPGTLMGFDQVIALSLELPAGKYVLHGRVQLMNMDGDRQNTSAGLRIRSSLAYPDNVDAYLTEYTSLTAPLQCVIDLPEGDTIDLVVSTYAGYWEHASVIAFAVDRLEPPL